MEHILKHPVKWQGSFFYPGLIGKADILIDSGIIFAIIKVVQKTSGGLGIVTIRRHVFCCHFRIFRGHYRSHRAYPFSGNGEKRI